MIIAIAAALRPSVAVLEAQTTIAYVQSNSAVPQSSQTSVSVTFSAAQTAGNLDVVVVGWNDAVSQVQSVVDSQGNVYALAVGPTVRAGFGSQSIYYAKNIKPAAAGGNIVTITFDQPAAFADVRIAEYRGLDPANPVDVTAAAQGSSTAANSGSVTTTTANDLLVGANLVSSLTGAAGSSYTARVITVPDGDILEDRIVTATGSYSATATLAPSGQWIMQLVAFRAAPTGPPDTQAPTAPTTLAATATSGTQINLGWTASTDNVGVTSYLIERCQGAACATFAQVGTASGVAFSNTGLTNGTSYSYRVRASDAAGNLSPYSNTATASTPDTQAPSAPAALAVTASSTTQINLAWTASTDNVGVTSYLIERCQGVGCSTFAQVGTSSSASFGNTGLTASTSYSYRVRATDAAGNLSGYSNVATASTPAAPDTQAPAAPSTLNAAATSASQINLTWTASTDNVGVTSYLIERCQGTGCSSWAQIGTATTPLFASTGLLASTSYSFRVRATDAAGNLSDYSNVATTSTQAADTQAPTAPSNLSASASVSTQVALTWTASTDNVAVTSYLIERCQGAACSTFAQIATISAVSFNDTAVSASTSYSYRVRATDAAGNLGSYSNVASVTTPTAATAAFVQSNSATPQTSQATVVVPFTGVQSAGDLNVVVVGWNSSVGTVQSVTDSRGNSYALAVGPTVSSGFATQSIYYAANIAAASAGANSVTVTFAAAVPFADIRIAEYSGISPINPVDVVAANQGSGASSDSGSVTISGAPSLLVGANMVSSTTTAAGTSFTKRIITTPDADILEDRIVTTVGSYNATATLASGTWIMQMVAFKVGQALPDSQPPTAPASLTATPVSGTQINLAWAASTDNVGVTAYRVERCQGAGCSSFVEITALSGTGTSYSDTAVVANTSYSYRVRATDAAGNLGGYSNTASATTPAPDTTPPSAPGTLTATAFTGTQINVQWGAATDDVGVAGYRLERCQGVGCSAFNKLGTTITGTSFSDTALSPNTSYSYIVRAQDAAGNLGPYSNVGSATTLATNPQLVAAFSFDEGTGTTVNDLSGSGNNGTVANGSWSAAGKFGKALSFNGVNTLLTIPDSPSLRLTTGMTLEAWVNPSSTLAGWRDVVYKGNDNYYLEGSTSNGTPGIGVTIGTATEAIAASALPVNTWTFLAATYDGTTLRFYVNGTQAASQTKSGSILTSGNPLQIGGDSIYGQFFSGMIDEVRVYSVALSAGQILSDMATAVGQSSAALSLSSASLNLGNVTVGTVSAPQSVTITNGGSLPLNIGSVTITGVDASNFGQTNNCVGTVPPQGTCSISVTFTPSSGGVSTATLAITDNAPGNPHSVSLTGNGTGFTISPTATVLTPSRTQQFTVSGAGTSSVVWSVDGVAGGDATLGMITTNGLYTPPSTSGVHNVTVATSDGTKSATATAYVSTNPGMFTHHNDNQRTGQNLGETVLTLSNVSTSTFGKLGTFTTDGISHASPLYVANVNIPSVGSRNVVYVSTEHDSVYAFDADALTGNPLWHVSFINPSAGITTVPNGDTGECCDIQPEIGITGTPVIDPSTSTLYVVAKTKEGSNVYRQRLHALDLATGAEKFGGPVLIQATVAGGGVGSTNGQLPFDSLRENQRTALLLRNGVVYFGFGSHGDNEPYHGWLMGYNATTLQQVLVFTSTPNGEGGGIWQSGGGLAIDSAGNFFFATGDGTFSVNSGGVDYGDSFVKFNPSSGVVDYFTPHDESNLNVNNLDLDAGGMILLPDQTGAHPHILVSAGKNGSVYVVDRDNMTHFHTSDQNVQTLVNAFPFGTPLPGNYSSPVYFNGAVYFGPVSDVVQAFKVTNGLLSTSPSSTTPQAFPYPGGALSISANGTSNGILWAVQKNGSASGTLHAYDASNLAFEIYNSDQAGTRDTLDVAAKFSIPLVINGKVFVATESKLVVFGLLP
ncbi:MAG TPA: fibronectin type III domain-containing protein [Vicinamibacterales bacterium]